MTRVFCVWCIRSVVPNFKQHFVNHLLVGNRGFGVDSHSLVYNDEVTEAKKNDRPIVALESTIITHGMPYPDNIETALRVEDIIRKQGACPATIGILGGRVCVGIDQNGLEKLASTESAKTVKCSRRDFPFVIANRLNGGTTVSGTILVANLAGIKIMATGGIGGVHRFAETTFDISADLIELGRTPVAVVCAGVKAILDIPKTLEFLETQGIPVVTIGEEKTFPAFYCRKTVDNIQSPYQVSTPEDAASLVKAQRELAFAGGILLAVPIPLEHSLDPAEAEAAIHEALKDAAQKNIKGKDTTPFLLQRLNELTAGKSLHSNKVLIENNARVAAKIAVHLSVRKIEDNRSTSVQSTVDVKKTGPIVIGGAIFDTIVQLTEPTINFDGGTHNGTSRESCGGVGRNVAAALINLGIKKTRLLSVVGDDAAGKTLRESLRGGDEMVEVLKDVNTARYMALVDIHGECQFGVGEMMAHKKISPSLIRKYKSQLGKATILVLDGNLPLETLSEVFNISAQFNIPVWYEPTDARKATKIFQNNEHWKSLLHFVSPNQNELLAIARYLEIPVPSDSSSLNIDTVKNITEKVAEHIPVVLTTLGSQGLLVSRKATNTDPFYDENGHLVLQETKVQTRLYSAISPSGGNQKNIVSVSGCGDCLAAGVIFGIEQGWGEAKCLKLALQAASLSLVSHDSVPATLSTIAMSLKSS
ncbi:pseudouridine-metabolizing bifunctional protein C1861.05 isoform X2 [Athalia rosae]|uniref:pseudouridine-metabolizing bifunctional protein C1861.05 isoform X2 n=1 Tax=Athalia rosae TaxID=37344 RepID=UPI0020335484|nr:pseudouridine-metabolizing bifunctional protein C1861.05 isoform X2 [Athalia rosae]